MKDGIIKADGTSRLMRATLPATYEALRAAAAAGDLPLDILFNAAGWSQQPSFLNKHNLLKDSTASMYGLDENAVPDDVLAFLGKYNLHWWRKQKPDSVSYEEIKTPGTKQIDIYNSYSMSDRHFDYAKSVSVDPVSGAVTLSNPTTLSVKTDEYALMNELIALAPVYVITKSGDVCYVRSGVTTNDFNWSNDDPYQLTLRNDRTGYDVVTAKETVMVYEPEFVCSSDRNAYPDNGVSGDYSYFYLGVPFDLAVRSPVLETGFYVGTGTFHSDSPNSITFERPPQLVMVMWGKNVSYVNMLTLTEEYQSSSPGFGEYVNYTQTKKSADGKTLTWYNTGDYVGQGNVKDDKYYYFAIG